MTRYGDLSYYKKQGTTGIGGQIYEIELSMLFLLRGIENEGIRDFCLASNMKEAAEFDDVVFKYHFEDEFGEEKLKMIFLQAKHKETREKEEKKITLNSLLSQSYKGDFILRKYLSSFSKIKYILSKSKNHSLFNIGLEYCEFIIYTNAYLSTNKECTFIKKNLKAGHILNIKGLSKESNHYFELPATEKIINALKPSLDFEILVKELSQTVLSESLDMNKQIFCDYHFQLRTQIIERVDKRAGMFKKTFLENINFMESIFKEVQNKIGLKSVADLKSTLSRMIIQLPEKFGNVEESDLEFPLPNKCFNTEEIKTFLSRLKLFVSQPNERQLGEILQQEVRSIYHLEPYDNAVFCHVKEKVQKWWRDGVQCLTKENTFFQDSAKVSFWFDIRPPNELFTGRDEEIMELHNKINRSYETVTVISQMTSISGLGGIGKTELAKRYAEQFASNYQNNIIWISAESKETLTEGFLRLAKDKLNIITKSVEGNDKSIESIIDGVYQFFSKRKCLFIFDNAVNCTNFRQFLPLKSLRPSDQKPYILITSRDREWGTGIEIMDLFVLKLEEAINLVNKGISIECNGQDKEVEMLVKKLQCFPLAIRQAIAYIANEAETRNYNISDYLANYDKKAKEFLKAKSFDSLNNDYIATTFTTWRLTINKIKREQNGNLALKILAIIAYIAPDNINRNMFLRLCKNQNKIISAIRLLVKYSMINSEKQQSTLNIHRLVQEVIRIELCDKNRQATFIHKTFDLFNHQLFLCDANDEFKNFQEIRQLYPHLEVFLNHIIIWNPENQSQHTILSRISNMFKKRRQIKLKNKYFQQLFKWLESAYYFYGPRRKIVLLEKILEYEKTHKKPRLSCITRITLLIGLCYLNLYDRQKGKKLLEEAVQMFEDLYGPEDINLVKPLLHLSNTYGFLDITGIDLRERSLKIMEKFYGDDYFRIGDTLQSLLISYSCIGDTQKYSEYLEKCLKSQEKKETFLDYSFEKYYFSDDPKKLKTTAYLYGKLNKKQKQVMCLERVLMIQEYKDDNEQQIIESLDILARTYGELGNYEREKELLERSLTLKEFIFSYDHYEVTDTLDKLANIYEILGDTTIQIELLERILGIYERYYGPHNFKIATTLEKLANIYGKLKDFQKQKQFLQRVLEIKEDEYGQENFTLINTLLLISNVHKKLTDYEEEKRLLERALKIAERHYGVDNFEIVKILRVLSNAYENLNDYNHKKGLMEKILVMQERLYGSNDFRIPKALTGLANTYGQLGDRTTQIQLLERALKLEEGNSGHESLDLVNILLHISSASEKLQDYHKQKKGLERALKIMEKYYGTNNFNTREMVEKYSVVYENVYDIRNEIKLLENMSLIKEMYSTCLKEEKS